MRDGFIFSETAEIASGSQKQKQFTIFANKFPMLHAVRHVRLQKKNESGCSRDCDLSNITGDQLWAPCPLKPLDIIQPWYLRRIRGPTMMPRELFSLKKSLKNVRWIFFQSARHAACNGEEKISVSRKITVTAILGNLHIHTDYLTRITLHL